MMHILNQKIDSRNSVGAEEIGEEKSVCLSASIDKTIVWLYFGQYTRDILSLV